MTNTRCPRYNSPAPHLHLAVQFEGEVGTCIDDFHLQATPSNRPEYALSSEGCVEEEATNE